MSIYTITVAINEKDVSVNTRRKIEDAVMKILRDEGNVPTGIEFSKGEIVYRCGFIF